MHTETALAERTDNGKLQNADKVDELSAFCLVGYAAFYADCEHEIRPVTAGYRVCLVYNLVQQSPGPKPSPAALEAHAAALAEALAGHQEEEEAGPAVILLGHQYTPENFSADALKLHDRARAQALLQAAERAGYYAKLCLVTSYQSGSPAAGGGYYDDDEDDLDDAEMEEVFDSSLSIEHWSPGGPPPPLRILEMEEEELLTSFPLAEGEPIEKESTGYMGNYGPDLMHWYHYGAVAVWSPETAAGLLPQQDAQTQLEWIAYYSRNRRRATAAELGAVAFVLSAGFSHSRGDSGANYNIIADWIMAEGDTDFFRRIPPATVASYFTLIDAAHWAKLLPFLKAEARAEVMAQAMEPRSVAALEQLLAVLRALAESGSATELLSGQVAWLPRYFSETLTTQQKTLTAVGLENLFWLEARGPLPRAWVAGMADALTGHAGRDFVHRVLAPRLLSPERGTPLAAALIAWCRGYLQRRIAIKPQPPADWRRELPAAATGHHAKQWALLINFLQSPTERVFDYVRAQAEREAMEAAIRGVEIDLKLETIQKGRPYTLRITKTQAAFERMLKVWKEDAALLERVVGRGQ